eukprot:COSAG01_NODE_50128_length_366_cov_0.580524_1_plen_84_part_01
MLLRLAASALLLACGGRSDEQQDLSLTFSTAIAGGVLQHGKSVSIWGSGAAPGAAVVVTLHAQPTATTADAMADEAGNFFLRLP